MSKPIVVFTNFWDAYSIIRENNLFIMQDKKLYRVDVQNCFSRTIYSLTLPISEYSSLFPEIRVETLNCLIPTVKLLLSLKSNMNWDKFLIGYKNILKGRKEKILSWVDSLQENRVYFCCCIEVTTNGVECHRKYLYNTFSKGVAKDRAIWIYRDGVEITSSVVYRLNPQIQIQPIQQNPNLRLQTINLDTGSVTESVNNYISGNESMIEEDNTASIFTSLFTRNATFEVPFNSRNTYSIGETVYLLEDGSLCNESDPRFLSGIANPIGIVREIIQSTNRFGNTQIIVRLSDDLSL